MKSRKFREEYDPKQELMYGDLTKKVVQGILDKFNLYNLPSEMVTLRGYNWNLLQVNKNNELPVTFGLLDYIDNPKVLFDKEKADWNKIKSDVNDTDRFYTSVLLNLRKKVTDYEENRAIASLIDAVHITYDMNESKKVYRVSKKTMSNILESRNYVKIKPRSFNEDSSIYNEILDKMHTEWDERELVKEVKILRQYEYDLEEAEDNGEDFPYLNLLMDAMDGNKLDGSDLDKWENIKDKISQGELYADLMIRYSNTLANTRNDGIICRSLAKMFKMYFV